MIWGVLWVTLLFAHWIPNVCITPFKYAINLMVRMFFRILCCHHGNSAVETTIPTFVLIKFRFFFFFFGVRANEILACLVFRYSETLNRVLSKLIRFVHFCHLSDDCFCSSSNFVTNTLNWSSWFCLVNKATTNHQIKFIVKRVWCKLLLTVSLLRN